jgi:hypothetical protein
MVDNGNNPARKRVITVSGSNLASFIPGAGKREEGRGTRMESKWNIQLKMKDKAPNVQPLSRRPALNTKQQQRY